MSQSTQSTQADHPKARTTFPRKTRIALYAHDSDPNYDIPICYKKPFYIHDLVSMGRAIWLTPKSAQAIIPGAHSDRTKKQSVKDDWITVSVSQLPKGQHLTITTKQLDA